MHSAKVCQVCGNHHGEGINGRMVAMGCQDTERLGLQTLFRTILLDGLTKRPKG